MYFSQLLEFKSFYSDELIDRADKYFAGLSPSAAKEITVSRFSAAMAIAYTEGADFIKRCLEQGLLSKHYVIRCPECNQLLRRLDNLEELSNQAEEIDCHHCGEVIDLNNPDTQLSIDISFSLLARPFVDEQQCRHCVDNQSEPAVAKNDSLGSAIQYKLVTYDDLFSPTEEEYLELKQLLAAVTSEEARNSTEKGNSLESLVERIFSLCKIFRTTTKLHSSINQIDCFVRINQIIQGGFLQDFGQFIIIECKNEKTVPSGEYLSKLHSVISIAGGHCGIFISKKSAPRTFKELVRSIYLQDRIFLIYFSLDEIESLIEKRRNILEDIEKKCLEIQTDATKDLRALGLY